MTKRRSVQALACGGLISLGLACGSHQPPAAGPARQPATPSAKGPLSVGKRSPTFARRTLGGDSVAVPTHKPVTVVFFFATWSEPDKVLATRIRELAHIYPDLAIVGVGLDDEDRSLRAMARAYGITYPIVWDEGHVLANAYHIETDPQTFVLDAEGKVLLIQFGYRRDDDAVLEAEIASRLKTDICERPLAIEDGPACFRHCSSIATAEKRCTTPDCHARCSARACRETCGSDNERRKAALEFCRRTRPRARDACEAACHAEAMNDAITACDYHSAGQSTLLEECTAVCGVGQCRASCRR